MASGSGQYSSDAYGLSSNDEKYILPRGAAEKTHGRSDRATLLLTSAWLYLNSVPVLTQNWGQINPNPNDYHTDPMQISSTLWIPDITDWGCQQEGMQSMYPDLSNVVCDIFSLILQVVGVKASFC